MSPDSGSQRSFLLNDGDCLLCPSGPKVAGAEPIGRSAVRALRMWPARAEERLFPGVGINCPGPVLSPLSAPPHTTTPHMDDPGLPEARPACPLVVRPWGVSCSCLTWLVFPGQRRRRRWRARQQPPEQRPLLGGADSPRGWYPSCPGPAEGRVADFVWEPRL